MGPEQYRFIETTQIATGLGIVVVGVSMAALVPDFAPWLPPSLGVLWAIGALAVARRLSLVGARSFAVRLFGLLIGLASVARIVYLVRIAA